MIETDCACLRALINATTIVITLFGIENDRGAAFHRVRDEDIHKTNIYASIASGTDVLINGDWATWGWPVGHGICFGFHALSSLIY
jgi:hypothetical protein